MKIVYLDFDDVSNPLLGAGQAMATKNVGSLLAQQGHEVVSVCSRYPGCKDRLENGIYYKHIGLGTRYIKINNAFYFFAVPIYVLRLKADVILECFTAPISTLFSPLFTKIPVVAMPSMFNAKEFTRKYKLPFHLFEKFGLRFYKYILPYSDVDKAKALRYNPKIVTKVIGQGVGNEFFKVKRGTPKYFLYFGRLDIDQKGIDLLLEAYAAVKDKTKYPLVIAGHGPDDEKVKKLINKLHIADRVKMIGPTYGQKKYQVFSNALVNTFPSRHDEMCLATLEVLAAGIPVVCFDIKESDWINDKVSIKAKPFDISEYSLALLKACDLKQNSKMSGEARHFAKNFSWQNVANQIESFLKDVVMKEGVSNND